MLCRWNRLCAFGERRYYAESGKSPVFPLDLRATKFFDRLRDRECLDTVKPPHSGDCAYKKPPVLLATGGLEVNFRDLYDSSNQSLSHSFGGYAKLLEDRVSWGADAEAIDADDLTLSADVFPPETGDAGFDSDALGTGSW